MASLRKRGDSWRVEISKNGVRDSGTFATKHEAQEWAVRRETEIGDGSGIGIVLQPLEEVLARYRDEVALWRSVRRAR